MPFIVWVALSLAILIIAGATGKIIIDPPIVVQPVVQAGGSHGYGLFGYAVALLIVAVAVYAYLKYRRIGG